MPLKCVTDIGIPKICSTFSSRLTRPKMVETTCNESDTPGFSVADAYWQNFPSALPLHCSLVTFLRASHADETFTE